MLSFCSLSDSFRFWCVLASLDLTLFFACLSVVVKFQFSEGIKFLRSFVLCIVSGVSVVSVRFVVKYSMSLFSVHGFSLHMLEHIYIYIYTSREACIYLGFLVSFLCGFVCWYFFFVFAIQCPQWPAASAAAAAQKGSVSCVNLKTNLTACQPYPCPSHHDLWCSSIN